MDFLSPCGSACTQMVEKIFLIALLVSIYNLLGYKLFSRPFFRQLVYVFQTIRMFLILAGILPPLLHNLVALVKTDAHQSFTYPLWVMVALILTLSLAYLLAQVGPDLERMLGLSRAPRTTSGKGETKR